MSRFKDSRIGSVFVCVVVALFLSGGLATAAKKWIDGKRIKPGSVAAKQLGKRSVNSSKIAVGAVRTNHLRNGSVTAAKLAPNAKTAGPTGATGPAGATGSTGPTGPSGSSLVYSTRSNPNFLISTGETMVLSETFGLGPAGYLVGGSLTFAGDMPGTKTVSCEVFRVFVNSSDIQTGASEQIGNPIVTVTDEDYETIPLSGIAELSSPPPDAANVQVRTLCETDTSNVVVHEIQLSAIPFDEIGN